MSSYNHGALTREDVEALRICAGASFHGPVELPSGRKISGEEATVLAAALVEQPLVHEPREGESILRCQHCNMGLRIGEAQLLCHQDGTPICNTPERTAWLSARHMLAIEPYHERSPAPRGIAAAFWMFMFLATLVGQLIWVYVVFVK